jgi:hypothetical protein
MRGCNGRHAERRVSRRCLDGTAYSSWLRSEYAMLHIAYVSSLVADRVNRSLQPIAVVRQLYPRSVEAVAACRGCR